MKGMADKETPVVESIPAESPAEGDSIVRDKPKHKATAAQLKALEKARAARTQKRELIKRTAMANAANGLDLCREDSQQQDGEGRVCTQARA